MPYFKNNNINLLFIHIPKTGGTSLERYFSEKYNVPLNAGSLYMFLTEEEKSTYNLIINSSLQHITYNDIIKYKDYFKIDMFNIEIITIVRNPYERLVSDLFFLKLINQDSSCEDVFNIINSYIISNELDNHNLPQHKYIVDENNNIISNIKVLKTESLTEEMHGLGYNDFNFKENTNSIVVDYYSYLNSNSIKLINDFYNNDFILFNYQKLHYNV